MNLSANQTITITADALAQLQAVADKLKGWFPLQVKKPSESFFEAQRKRQKHVYFLVSPAGLISRKRQWVFFSLKEALAAREYKETRVCKYVDKFMYVRDYRGKWFMDVDHVVPFVAWRTVLREIDKIRDGVYD